jgi:hypothetical protein
MEKCPSIEPRKRRDVWDSKTPLSHGAKLCRKPEPRRFP